MTRWWQTRGSTGLAGPFATGATNARYTSAVGLVDMNVGAGPNTSRWAADIASRRTAQRNANNAYYTALFNQQQSVDRTRSSAVAGFAATRLRESTARAGAIFAAEASNAAASLRASEAASQSGRLFTEFESRLAQTRALRQRDLDRAVGQSTAGFGAAGIQSTGAVRDIERESALRGAISESQANTQRLGIIGQGRAGITDAIASSVASGGRLTQGLIGSFGREASALSLARNSFRDVDRFRGRIARREVSQVSGITPNTSTSSINSLSAAGVGGIRTPIF